MVYMVKSGQVETWFATLRKENGWELHLTKGIDRDRVREFVKLSPSNSVRAT